jgi:hypothetical protein
MNMRAELTHEVERLPRHSRGRRPMEQILRRLTKEELEWDRAEQRMIAELSAAFDEIWETPDAFTGKEGE